MSRGADRTVRCLWYFQPTQVDRYTRRQTRRLTPRDPHPPGYCPTPVDSRGRGRPRVPEVARSRRTETRRPWSRDRLPGQTVSASLYTATVTTEVYGGPRTPPLGRSGKSREKDGVLPSGVHSPRPPLGSFVYPVTPHPRTLGTGVSGVSLYPCPVRPSRVPGNELPGTSPPSTSRDPPDGVGTREVSRHGLGSVTGSPVESGPWYPFGGRPPVLRKRKGGRRHGWRTVGPLGRPLEPRSPRGSQGQGRARHGRPGTGRGGPGHYPPITHDPLAPSPSPTSTVSATVPPAISPNGCGRQWRARRPRVPLGQWESMLILKP